MALATGETVPGVTGSWCGSSGPLCDDRHQNNGSRSINRGDVRGFSPHDQSHQRSEHLAPGERERRPHGGPRPEARGPSTVRPSAGRRLASVRTGRGLAGRRRHPRLRGHLRVHQDDGAAGPQGQGGRRGDERPPRRLLHRAPSGRLHGRSRPGEVGRRRRPPPLRGSGPRGAGLSGSPRDAPVAAEHGAAAVLGRVRDAADVGGHPFGSVRLLPSR